jgi:hypothetical protein
MCPVQCVTYVSGRSKEPAGPWHTGVGTARLRYLVRLRVAGALACNRGSLAGVEHFTETRKVGDNALIRLVAAIHDGWVY